MPRSAFANPWTGIGGKFGRSSPICSIAGNDAYRQRDQLGEAAFDVLTDRALVQKTSPDVQRLPDMLSAWSGW